MLIRFYVQNFLSYAEETEFSMIPGKGLPHDNQVITVSKYDNFPVLKGSIFYGANASGKSNFIKAINAARSTIIHMNQKGDIFPDNRYKLNSECRKFPTKFEFEIKTHSGNYSYGFTFTPEKVVEEWLFLLKKENEVPVFERKKDKITLNNKVFKNKEDRNRLNYMFEDLLTNQLYLTAVNNRNIKNMKNTQILTEVFNWFEKNLIVLFPGDRYRLWNFIKIDEEFIKYMKNMLSALDTGISDIRFEERDIKELFKKIPEKDEKAIKAYLSKNINALFSDSEFNRFIFYKDNDNIKAEELRTVHTTNTESCSFKFADESDGTKRLTDILPLYRGIRSYSKVIFIDEIDRSLHTELTHKILEIFLHLSGDHHSQLIATTHDIGLLDLTLFRKDEIWFVEKDKEGKSKLYSLYEFKPRKDLNIKNGYLKGRFGAIPHIKNSIDTLLKEMSI